MLARNPVSFVALDAWLSTRDPNETYDYGSYCDCLFARYLDDTDYASGSLERNKVWRELHTNEFNIARPERGSISTMGEARERLRKMVDSGR